MPPREPHSAMRHGRLALLVMCGALLALPSATAHAASCANVGDTLRVANGGAVRSAVVCLVNAERADGGLAALVANNALATSTRLHVADMLTTHYFSQTSLTGFGPPQRAFFANYSFLPVSVGEVIAAGPVTAKDVVAEWMDSPEACWTLMSPNVVDIGVGALPGVPLLGASLYDTGETATWAVDVSLPFGATPPVGTTDAQEACLAPKPPEAAPETPKTPDPIVKVVTVTVTAPAPAPTPANPKPVSPLTATIKRAGRKVTVTGAIAPAARNVSVTVRVKRGSRTVTKTVKTSSSGAFTAKVTAPKGTGKLTVEISARGTKVSKTVR